MYDRLLFIDRGLQGHLRRGELTQSKTKIREVFWGGGAIFFSWKGGGALPPPKKKTLPGPMRGYPVKENRFSGQRDPSAQTDRQTYCYFIIRMYLFRDRDVPYEWCLMAMEKFVTKDFEVCYHQQKGCKISCEDALYFWFVCYL